MAVYLKPCNGCPLRAGCEQRDEFRRRVAGLGLRTATFNCAKLDERLAPGTRIVIKHPVKGETSEPYEYDISYYEVPATITSSKDGEFACVIDLEPLKEVIDVYAVEGDQDPNKTRFRKYMKHRRIVRFLDEPKRRICENGNVTEGETCARPEGHDCHCKIARDATRGLVVA